MKPVYMACALVLAWMLALALLGYILIKIKWVRPRHAGMLARVATLLVLGAAYALTQFDWPGVHLRALDFWSLMVILGILCYSLIHAAVTRPFKDFGNSEFSKSYMLSMLYTDSEQLRDEDMVLGKPPAGPAK